MSSRFPTLATEIIELIATFLEPVDLRFLRLVSRELNRKTLRSFGRANFATIHTDLSHESLERIRTISKSEHFARHVQCLQVKAPRDGIIDKRFHWPRRFSRGLAKNFNRADLLRDLLSQCLLNCRSFVIYNSEPPHDTDCLVPNDAVGLILSIVARADIALQSFTVRYIPFSLPNWQWLEVPLSQTPKFVKAWSQIEELALDFAVVFDHRAWVLLVLSAPKLRKLSLRFGLRDTSLFMQQLSSLHELNKLEELSLSPYSATEEAITSLLLKNRDTLHSLSLEYIILEHEWSTIFENMKGQFPQLQNFELFCLKETANFDRLVCSALLKYPVIPGSEVRGPKGDLEYDSRRIESMADPVRLRYWCITKVGGNGYRVSWEGN